MKYSLDKPTIYGTESGCCFVVAALRSILPPSFLFPTQLAPLSFFMRAMHTEPFSGPVRSIEGLYIVGLKTETRTRCFPHWIVLSISAAHTLFLLRLLVKGWWRQWEIHGGRKGAYLGTQGVRVMNPPLASGSHYSNVRTLCSRPPPSPQFSRGPCPARERGYIVNGKMFVPHAHLHALHHFRIRESLLSEPACTGPRCTAYYNH